MIFKLYELWENPDEILKVQGAFDEKLKALGIKLSNKYKAKIVGGNIKLGSMGSFSKLYGDNEYDTKGAFDKDYVDINNIENKDAYKELATLKGSCGNYCEGCKNACYVAKSYLRYSTVVQGHSRNSAAMRNLERAFYDLDNQLSRKRIPFKIIRVHQSGEFESEDEFRLWCNLARRHPETTFYVYTKAYDLIEKPMEEGYAPDNFHILISVWENFGVEEFKRYSKYNNVKAFACIGKDDNGKLYDYESNNDLHITSYCTAYDKNGHLDHRVTCDKCKKCFSDKVGGKVIGCYEH